MRLSFMMESLQDLLDMGIVLRNDHDETFWKAAASLKGRHARSLPDAFCIALAQRIGRTVVTTDHMSLIH